jgi:hypothetical protein
MLGTIVEVLIIKEGSPKKEEAMTHQTQTLIYVIGVALTFFSGDLCLGSELRILMPHSCPTPTLLCATNN